MIAALMVPTVGAVMWLLRGADASATPDVLGPGPVTVRLDVEHSRFEPARVLVRPHTEVRFVVVNHDPIRHELIVGDGDLHARHENGTEAAHPPRPGEVTVDPGRTGSTRLTFHEPGVVRYACHLPGHLAYGMQGKVVVDAAPGERRQLASTSADMPLATWRMQ
jgi:uncharacterized cupredoxin-like copper-binding protein